MSREKSPLFRSSNQCTDFRIAICWALINQYTRSAAQSIFSNSMRCEGSLIWFSGGTSIRGSPFGSRLDGFIVDAWNRDYYKTTERRYALLSAHPTGQEMSPDTRITQLQKRSNIASVCILWIRNFLRQKDQNRFTIVFERRAGAVVRTDERIGS